MKMVNFTRSVSEGEDTGVPQNETFSLPGTEDNVRCLQIWCGVLEPSSLLILALFVLFSVLSVVLLYLSLRELVIRRLEAESGSATLEGTGFTLYNSYNNKESYKPYIRDSHGIDSRIQISSEREKRADEERMSINYTNTLSSMKTFQSRNHSLVSSVRSTPSTCRRTNTFEANTQKTRTVSMNREKRKTLKLVLPTEDTTSSQTKFS